MSSLDRIPVLRGSLYVVTHRIGTIGHVSDKRVFW